MTTPAAEHRPQQGSLLLRPLRAVGDKLADLWLARELLRQFVAKELKIRYKNSALGFLWSLVTPAAMTIVFTIVFAFVIRIPVEDFAAFFLAGYLVWQFHQNSAQGSIHSIVGNGPLIKKVYFPREVLPLSIVISQLVHLLLALVAVSPYLVVARDWGIVTHLPAVLVGVVLLAVFTSGVSMLLAGANVSFRDLQELIVVLFLLWFYATPIIYPIVFVTDAISNNVQLVRLFNWVITANPMTWFVRLFRESIYGTVVKAPPGSDSEFTDLPPSWPDPEVFVVCTVVAAVTFTVGYLAFHRFALSFAKEV